MSSLSNQPPDHGVLFILGRMEGKQDAFIQRLATFEQRLEDHETRVGELEDSHLHSRGFMSALVLIASTLGGLLVSAFPTLKELLSR